MRHVQCFGYPKSPSNERPKPDTHSGYSASRKAILRLRRETTQTCSGGPVGAVGAGRGRLDSARRVRGGARPAGRGGLEARSARSGAAWRGGFGEEWSGGGGPPREELTKERAPGSVAGRELGGAAATRELGEPPSLGSGGPSPRGPGSRRPRVKSSPAGPLLGGEGGRARRPSRAGRAGRAAQARSALLAARSLAATVRSLAALAPRLPAATVPRVVGRGEREERFGAWGVRWRGEVMGT